ncbi:PREDICTED: papilin-like [Amphimedon queenslandica]|uniref:Ig-like domain-containing protein n=1 Tax=Amphimedon queenslandica TaxID=400682 RepID=A0A1X7T0N5_AMPQE|nr:PREDICTED: papilin-like [Amphimedon queenslandica]|eukprot:XP_019861922.1 PREDICTED: papilin-like [Amphimedon queenslandica]
MWLFIAEGSTEAVPINASDPNIMISDDGMNSVLMINPFEEAYAGTYRCNTTNIAGTDAGDVNVVYKPPEEKEWLVSTWSKCFPNCHHGVRNRTVVCVTVSNHMVMDGCTPPPPPSEEQCTERGPCTEWVPGNWSVCTKTCGIGYQVRRVTCRATYDNTIELNDSECLTARPPVFRYCNIHDCPCIEPAYCSYYVGTEMCWRTEVQRDCWCTCGPAP